MTMTDQLTQLRDDVMLLLLTVTKEVAGIEELTTRARTTSTLFARANRVADVFGRRAAALQMRATNKSVALSVRRIQHLLLVTRAERLGADRRVRRDLHEINTLLKTWTTDPAAAQEGEINGLAEGQE